MTLKVGKEIQLKEVIRLLMNEEMKNGSSLKRQIKEINKVITYDEIPKTRPKRIIITNILETEITPKISSSQKQDIIKLRGKYQKIITPLLLKELKKSPNNSVLLTHTSIMKITGLVNEDYINKRKKIFATSKELGIHPSNLMYFNNIIGEEFNRIIKRELEKMKSKKIIDIEKVMMIHYYIKDNKGNSYSRFMPATKEMKDIINIAQYKILEEMDATLKDINKNKGKREKYFREVNKMVKKNIEYILYRDLSLDIEWDRYFSKCYETCKISLLNATIDCELQDEKYKEYMKELNNIAIDFINKNTKNIKNSLTRISDLKLVRYNKEINDRMIKENMDTCFIEGFGDESIINSYTKDVDIIIKNLIEI
ncbi:hypothetical protein TPELB_14110 [Terrisporobacter petrolearius]|uniref:Uncharacterized protein n=1 Tax=Terrisporobacter petrolearius TaxID=1460447 RepID=A0ABZ3FBB9_9FIRM